MKHLNTAQIDKYFSEVAKDKERVILTSHGKELAAIVPVEDIKLLEELEEEDRRDIEAAQSAEKEAE